MEENLKQIDDMIFYLFNIRNQVLAELPVSENGGYTDEEYSNLEKAYIEASKDYKLTA